MSIETTIHLNVDFYDDRYTLIRAKQGDDSSRWITVACYSQGEFWRISESKYSVYVRYKKPNGYGGINYGRINARGEALIELTYDMLSVAGICTIDLIIADKGTAVIDVNTGKISYISSASVLSTLKFQIDVSEAAIDNSIIEDLPEYTCFVEAIETANANFSDVVLAAKSWAVGDTNITGRDNEDTDNSKYYSKMSRSYALGDIKMRNGEATDNSEYYSRLSKSYAVGDLYGKTGTASRDDEGVDNAEYYSRLAKSYAKGDLDGDTETREKDVETVDNAEYYSRMSKSYAMGGTGIEARDGEDTNNAEYYSRLAKSYTLGSSDGDTGTRDGESIDNAKYYYEQALANAIQSESWAVGNTDARDGENINNSEYYSQMSKSYAMGGTGLDARTDEDVNNAEYYSRLAKSYTMGDSDGSTNTREDEATENAKTYMENALEHSVVSQRYAVGGTNTVEDEDTDNAKYYYEQSNISASNASVSESNASTSESNAANYMSEAQNYATQSQRYAVGGTGTADGEDEDNSKYYCNKALESASNVEANADVISNAAIVATSQANLATENASAAAASADLASDSADLAYESANAASTSATSASTSETNAANSASEAHTYYLQAEEVVTGLSGAFIPQGTIEFAELATLLEGGEVQAGYLYHISDNFTTDATFAKGEGVEYSAGTNVYMTSSGVWDCLAATTVSGVKGGKETEYRQGNVNITVENIGAISSDDIATVDEVISYLGI